MAKKKKCGGPIGLARIMEITNHVSEDERGMVTKRELFEAVRFWSSQSASLAGSMKSAETALKIAGPMFTLRFFQGAFPAGRGWRLLKDDESIVEGDQEYDNDRWRPVACEAFKTIAGDHYNLVRRKINYHVPLSRRSHHRPKPKALRRPRAV